MLRLVGNVLKYITIHDKYVYPFRGVSDPFWSVVGVVASRGGRDSRGSRRSRGR